MREETRPSRRQLLAAVGSGSLAGLAGCGTRSDGEGAVTAGESQDGTTDGATPSPTPTTEAAAPTPTTETWTAGGPPDRSRWSVTFQDAFESGDLDADVWRNGFGEYPLDCPVHEGPDHCAVPDNSFVADGRLVLEATAATPDIPPEEDWDGREQPSYSAGAVHTEGAFEQEFGYFETKSRVPTEPGTLPGSWFFIDIDEHDWREPHVYEKYGGGPGVEIEMGANWGEGDQAETSVGAIQRSDRGRVELDAPTHERFIVYALEWGPDYLSWHVDGERVARSEHPGIADQLAGEPVYWVLQNVVMTAADWIGDPAEADLPSRHEVEWVRAWQREDWA